MALSPGHARLYAGDFNVMSQEWQDDGTVILTLHRHADSHAVRLHVSNLYGPLEMILAEDTVPIGPPAHILARQQEAQQ